jgi:hypothetical protein
VKAFVEFSDPDAAKHALSRLKSLGYLDIETYGPFPLTDEDAHAPRGSVAISIAAFSGGLFALVAAYLIQWYANVASYPLNIGGRPAHAAPAFIPATFETICLFATGALFLGFLVLERLPRLWQPIFEIDGFERSSVDRFWIVLQVAASTTARERLTTDIVPLDPLRIVVSEEDA